MTGSTCRHAAWLAALLFALALLPLQAPAVTPEEMLSDPALESRARALSKQLRCLVCQNQSIDDSDAELARDLRIEVRKQLAAGAADDEILAALRETYGDYVLLNPPVSPATYILWGAPVVILIGGAAIMLAGRRRRDEATEDTATETAPSEAAAPAIDRRTGLALGSLVMAASLGLYLLLGRADLPAQPLSERGAEIAAALKQAETVAGTRDDALAEARAAAARTPSNVGAWLRLAMAAAASGDRETEMTALQQAETLTDGDPAIRAMRAEAMARAADGQVTVPARRLVAEILAVNPAEPRALFLSGLAAWSRMAPDDRQTLAEITGSRGTIWVEGNHDQSFVPPGHSACTEHVEAGLVFRHIMDEADPRPEISAHYHPAGIVSHRGARLRRSCFVQAGTRFMLPAFGALTGGLDCRDPALAALHGRATQLFLLGEDSVFAPPPGWQRLARAYEVLGRPRDAQVALIGAADAAPGDLRAQLAALEQMVVAQLEAAFADAASRLLERATSLGPHHPETLYLGGHFAKLNGDPQTARRLWEALLGRLPDDAPIIPQLRAAIASL